MCGIAGYINLEGDIQVSVIRSMTESLVHRGPDDGDVFMSDDKKVSLGHRRLSFLDLSKSGKQPMQNNAQNAVITFNGEIYNHAQLRAELSDFYHFNTGTDTEVILAGYQKWGIGVVNKLKGMFAFALWDQATKQIFLVRDRFGIKPLYYAFDDKKLLFASELKAIHASGEFTKEIDYSAFVDFFVYRYIPSPKTIWKGAQKLPPAHYLAIDTDTLKMQSYEYWELSSTNIVRSEDRVIARVGTLLQKSVGEHICADVPIGAFLSGGYDSSALVYYMTQACQKPQTFSIGFSKWEKSEDQFADIAAKHLSVPNSAVVADEKSLEFLDLMPIVYDEPIADISIIPTYMVSKLARTKVKAVVGGEGADEIFAGYTWQHDFYDKSYPDSVLKKIKNKIKPVDTVAFYAQAMAMGEFDEAELKKMLHPDLHQYIPEDIHWFYRSHFRKNLSPLKSVQYLDIKCFMGELVLTKVDRASMANSLEVRVPFLDHELFEYIFGLDEKRYRKKNQTKYLLYKNIENALPQDILQRKKQGFVGPDSYYMDIEWYKKELKESKLVECGLVNQSYIDELLKETYTWKLWKLLVMEKWFQRWCMNTK